MKEEEKIVDGCERDLNSYIFGESEGFVSKLRVSKKEKRVLAFYFLFQILFSFNFFGF